MTTGESPAGIFPVLLDNESPDYCFGILLLVPCQGPLDGCAPFLWVVAFTLDCTAVEIVFRQSLFHSLSPQQPFPASNYSV